MEFTLQQLAILERLHSRGFEIVAFPMYANYVGIRKWGPQVGGESSSDLRSPVDSIGVLKPDLGDLSCAALLVPIPGGTFSIYAKPTLLIGGNFTVRVTRNGRDYFVWKKEQLEATPARVAELDSFASALSEALLPTA
jgi:hypothetical protein